MLEKVPPIADGLTLVIGYKKQPLFFWRGRAVVFLFLIFSDVMYVVAKSCDSSRHCGYDTNNSPHTSRSFHLYFPS